MESQSYLRYESMNQLSKTKFGRYGYFNALGPLSHSLTAHKHTSWNGKRSNRTAKTASMVVDECAREHTVEIYGWGQSVDWLIANMMLYPTKHTTMNKYALLRTKCQRINELRGKRIGQFIGEKDRSVYWNEKWGCGGRPLTEVTPRTPGGRRGGVSPRNKHALLRTKGQRFNELRGKRISRYTEMKGGIAGGTLTQVTATTSGGRGGAPPHN